MLLLWWQNLSTGRQTDRWKVKQYQLHWSGQKRLEVVYNYLKRKTWARNIKWGTNGQFCTSLLPTPLLGLDDTCLRTRPSLGFQQHNCDVYDWILHGCHAITLTKHTWQIRTVASVVSSCYNITTFYHDDTQRLTKWNHSDKVKPLLRLVVKSILIWINIDHFIETVYTGLNQEPMTKWVFVKDFLIKSVRQKLNDCQGWSEAGRVWSEAGRARIYI